MALKDKTNDAVASGAAVGERDNWHGESFAVLHSVAFYCDCGGGHLLLSATGVEGNLRVHTEAHEKMAVEHAVTRAKGGDGAVGAPRTQWSAC